MKTFAFKDNKLVRLKFKHMKWPDGRRSILSIEDLKLIKAIPLSIAEIRDASGKVLNAQVKKQTTKKKSTKAEEIPNEQDSRIDDGQSKEGVSSTNQGDADQSEE